MNSNKRDIYFKGRIYVDVDIEDFFPMGEFKDRLTSLTSYQVQGSHSFTDGMNVTGRYELERRGTTSKLFDKTFAIPTPAPVADNPDHIFNPVAELPKEADGKETIKDYLENRIKGLYEADAAFCKDRWDMNLGPNERGLAREMSNQVTFARQELQEALKHL